ncbi:hypothetical protein A3SI_19987 [Nitritalea halalkaliphila LW7]|uniref:Uncharacterized protein n=1 Tax=Nitritalea halalkaliphila LW7 TaxID=1189621 RepID=I5BRG6_9BACT|nr:hypothetical protein A3SI_19987 [Nitritalea halalkaliphila LW7]
MNIQRAKINSMELINYIGILCVILFILNDILKNKKLLSNRKMLLLAILNAIYLIIVAFVLLANYSDLMNYWWLLIVGGLPSFYYQYLRIKNSDDPLVIQLIKLSVIFIMMIIIYIKV